MSQADYKANARSGNCERPNGFGTKLTKYTAAALVALTLAGILPMLAKAGLDAITAGMPEWAQLLVLGGAFFALSMGACQLAVREVR